MSISHYWNNTGNGFYKIYLDKITNDDIDKIDITKNDPNVKIMEIYGCANTCYDLDIDKLFSTFVNIESLYFEIYSNMLVFPLRIQKIPNGIKYFRTDINLDVIEYPNTLKIYKFDNYDHDPIIPNNLPQQTTCLILYCKNILTLNNVSEFITILILDLDHIHIDIWPLNLKELRLCFNDTISYFGILPYGLEKFSLVCKEYYHMLHLPPTLQAFTCSFANNFIYKYLDMFNALPDSIKYLYFSYYGCPNISVLPKNCEMFYYYYCPSNIIDILKEKYKNVKIFACDKYEYGYKNEKKFKGFVETPIIE